MAPEAIHRHADESVTAIAELTGVIDRNRMALLVPACVAIDASPETVPFGANPEMDGVVALMQQKLHVIAAHDGRWLDTLLAMPARDIGQRDSISIGQGLGRGQKYERH